jgi:uncharacterized protein (DUF697 family)
MDALLGVIPIIIKYVGKKRKDIDIVELGTDIAAVVISAIITFALDRKTAKYLKELKKGKKMNKQLRQKAMKFKFEQDLLGENISIAVEFSPTVIQLIYNIIWEKK